MTATSLDPAAFHRLIEEFAVQLPGLLSGHHVTADLALGCGHLLAALETPFTVAIVGQMRSGKSSLINALVGADLAITGVNETTATINWFRHGSPGKSGVFRVNWKDRPAEDFPLVDIQKWVGDSERARSTLSLEFFADVPFLRKANVVDTPGTRSVLAGHTRATEDFLELRQDRENRKTGEAADAVIYVLPPVARESDADLLREFGRTTRLTGSSPYNSLAVVHKWETLEVPDPYESAIRKCEKVREALGGLLGVVLPVSAPLGRAVEVFPQEFWHGMFEIQAGTPQDLLEDILLTERAFVSMEDPATPLGVSARRELRSRFPLPWASFKALLRIARRRNPGDPDSLRSLISAISGMDTLRDALDSRFLGRAKILKAFTVISKGLEPSEVAMARLRNHRARQVSLMENVDRDAGPALARAVENGALELRPALQYVMETRHMLEKEVLEADKLIIRLGEILVRVKDASSDLDSDIKMLEVLEGAENLGGWRPVLKALFGAGGSSLVDRMAMVGCDPESVDRILGLVQAEIVRCPASTRPVFEHARSRLQQIADMLES